LGTAATTGLLYQPRMISEGDCGEIGGMKIGRGNRSTRRKPAPARSDVNFIGYCTDLEYECIFSEGSHLLRIFVFDFHDVD
jgi:hypothetical protein